jgi:hypothetical protein
MDAVIGIGGNFAVAQQVMLGAGDGCGHWTVSLPFVSAPSWRGTIKRATRVPSFGRLRTIVIYLILLMTSF